MATIPVQCPLCWASEVAEVATLSATDLVSVYRRHLNIDVSRFFDSAGVRYLHCHFCDLRFFSPTVTGDPDFYRALSRLEFYYMADKSEFRVARGYIEQNARVLEIGGGAGAFGRSLSSGQYVGLETNQDAVSTARRHGLNMVNESVEEHASINSETYDVVCTFQVLEHVDDPARFMRAALLSLKKGGRLIISVPSAESFVRHVVNDILNVPPHHVTVWSDLAILNLAKLFALEVDCIQHEKLATYHYGWYLSAALRSLWSRPGPSGGPILDVGFGGRMRSRIFGVLGRVIAAGLSPILRRLPNAFLPVGHTVVAVFRKPAGGQPPA